MIDLNPDLLFSEEYSDFLNDTPINGSTINGTYNPMQFVLRLSKDIHLTLKYIKPGIRYSSELTSNQVQAFSSFMHENIHWWQHVGSNFGFISSLMFPVQTHINHSDLKKLIENKQAFKSILKYSEILFRETGRRDNPHINKILNNWFDIYFAGKIAFDPKSIHKIVENEYFLSVGHSYHILWATAIHTLASTIDSDFSFLPKIKNWDENFKLLENNKVMGFYSGSDIGVPPFGTKAIFEGQARFNQIQYLYFALEKKFDFEDFSKTGMLKDIYVEAFNFFLRVIGEQMPRSPDNHLVGLFLLVCDLAINPPEGFPLDLYYFDSFIISNDPGYRFGILCNIIKDKVPKIKDSIKDYSKEEYEKIGDLLSREMSCLPPRFGTHQICNWINEKNSIKSLLDEESIFKFSNENLSIRLFFSKFLRFQEDKDKFPQLFCWPGVCFTNQKNTGLSLDLVEKIFNKHRALFIDDIDGDIYPMIFEGVEEKNILETFNQFFTWNTAYDKVRSWIIEEGDFSYDYEWLTTKYSNADTKKWVCDTFKNVFNIHPDEIKVL